MALTYTTNAPEAKSYLVPPGEYRLRIKDAEEQTSKSGNPMVKLTLRVLKEDGTEGVAVHERIPFTPTTYWKVDLFLQACGKHPGEGVQVSLDVDEMVGWEFRARLKHEKLTNGSTDMAIDAYLPDSDDF